MWAPLVTRDTRDTVSSSRYRNSGSMLTARPALGCMVLLREHSAPQVRSLIVSRNLTLIFPASGGSEGGDDAGQCPAASPLSEAECAGAVSTCWSPGQRDTDCPSNGLCCVSTNLNRNWELCDTATIRRIFTKSLLGCIMAL